MIPGLMWRRARVLGPLVGILLVGMVVQPAVPALAHDTEAKLQDQLNREHNPVKRAKLEVRLGKLKLERAFGDYRRGEFQNCLKSLDEYQKAMQDAWTELESSGRSAVRKPSGFKQLEIALRESRRRLVDFEGRISYLQRHQVEKIRKETERLHNRVLDALFPSLSPAAKKPRLAGSGPPRTGAPKGGP
jgi:DNA-directed RNA polymerase subunit K/omega